MREKSYEGQFDPWIPNHLVDTVDKCSADFLMGAVYIEYLQDNMEKAAHIKNLMDTALLTNFYLTYFSAKKEEDSTDGNA
jgi:hypothetical protein